VLHGPEELGYPPLTEAMVNIRATLDEAARCRILPPHFATQLTEIAKSLFYKERTYDAVWEAAVEAGIPETLLQDLVAWLPAGRIDQKRRDAEMMLDAIRAHLATPVAPLCVAYTLAETAAWEAARRRVSSSC
jgi:hypothetical protein